MFGTLVSVPEPTVNPLTVLVSVFATYARLEVEPPLLLLLLVCLMKNGPHPVNAIMLAAISPETATFATRPDIHSPLAGLIISN
jgi:hypothetical protein